MNRPLLNAGDEALTLLQADSSTEVDEARVIRRNILRIWSAFKLRWWVPFLTTTLMMGLYATYKLVRPPEYRAYGLVQLGMHADLTGSQARDWAPRARGRLRDPPPTPDQPLGRGGRDPALRSATHAGLRAARAARDVPGEDRDQESPQGAQGQALLPSRAPRQVSPSQGDPRLASLIS